MVGGITHRQEVKQEIKFWEEKKTGVLILGHRSNILADITIMGIWAHFSKYICAQKEPGEKFPRVTRKAKFGTICPNTDHRKKSSFKIWLRV